MITSKQRAYLRQLSAMMDPIFQIGKQGVSPEVVQAIDDALEARELIKITVLNNCEELGGDPYELCNLVASRTHAEPVQVVGHRFVIYRASKKPKIELPKAKKAKK